MKKELRMICFDEELQIEAYRFTGLVKPFPNHFHAHYVIGFIEEGERVLTCNNKEHVVGKGAIQLFNPFDNHACQAKQDEWLDYRGFTISREVMCRFAREASGSDFPPVFIKNVLYDSRLSMQLVQLHQMLMNEATSFEKEENLYILLSLLFEKCLGDDVPLPKNGCPKEIELACQYMEQNYACHLTLEHICDQVHMSKSSLLRAFTKKKGITPYRYLQALRINQAKHLLECGTPPLEAALQTGFSDQSHFTNFFTTFIGVTPGAYQSIFSTRELPIVQGEQT